MTVPIGNDAAKLKDISRYRDRVMGCWLGKAVGGTLGVPFEGQDGPLDIDFYTPVPTEMLPNDDLDLQVVWACILDQQGANIQVSRHNLARAWRENIEFPWDEYGVAIRNLRDGLHPPLSGSWDNWFAHGMGAPIRSEIWACLAPANPQLAAAYAYEDACVDHEGDGIWGEVFLAALESMAFVESDPDRLLHQAEVLLPEASLIRRAVSDTRRWWAASRDWRRVREEILTHYGHENFTDAPMNIAFTVLGWLAGEGDFSRAICIANNCGKDTDCTAATVGALMGILDPDGIPERWLAPIGRDLVLSPGIIGISPPATLDEFTDLVLDLRGRLNGKMPVVQEQKNEQSAEHLKFTVDLAFADTMPLQDAAPVLSDARPMTLPGTFAGLPHAAFEKDIVLLRYRVTLPTARRVRIMFNTPERCRIWVDGVYQFGREGGAMSPSFHRAPEGQTCDMDLAAGMHEMVVALQKPRTLRSAQWVAGVGDAGSHQWLPGVFRE